MIVFFFRIPPSPFSQRELTSKAGAPILSEFAARVEFFRLQN